MKDNLTRHDVTPKFQQTVHELLVATAAASVTREAVDDVRRQVLVEVKLLDRSGKQISDPERDWTCEDEEKMALYWATLNNRLQDGGVKPLGMGVDYCPALVAKQEQLEIEWALLDEAAKMLGIYEEAGSLNSGLLCMKDGLGRRQEFLDACIGLVLALDRETT